MTRVIPPQGVVNDWTPQQKATLNRSNEGNAPDGRRRVESAAQSREEFLHESAKAYNADIEKLNQLYNKREWILMNMRMRPLFHKDDLIERLEDLDKKIEAVKSDLDYNRQNMNNCRPDSMPIPPLLPEPPKMFYVCEGDTMMCPMAIPILASTNFIPDPSRTVFYNNKKMGNISDCKPLVNVCNLGICTTLTANACGIVPQPCIAALAGPWMPGKTTVLVQGSPALMSTDTAQCSVGGRVLVQPKPSRIGDGVKEAAKDVRDKATEEGLKKLIKEGSKLEGLAKSRAFGPVVGGAWDVLEYGYDVITGKNDNAKSFDELGKHASEYWQNISNTSGVIESLENGGYVVRGGFKLAGEALSAAGGEMLGEPGAVIFGGVGAVVGGLGDTAGWIADGMVGTGESIGSATAVDIAMMTGDPRMSGDKDIFGDDEALYMK